MLGAVGFAAVAACCWGVADFAVARLGDRMSTFATFAHVQVGGFLSFLALAGLVGTGPLPAARLAHLLALGALGAAAYLVLYAALQVGPVAVASPLAATNGAVAALFEVALVGEALGPLGRIGLALLTVGVVAAAVDPDRLRDTLDRGLGAVAPGAALAAAAALALGGTMFAFDAVVGDVGLVGVLLVVRFVGALVALPLFRSRRVETPASRVRASALAVGAIDAAGFAGFVLGLRAGRVAVVGPVSSLFGVVTVLLAWLFLRESLSRVQQVGVALVLVGTPLLAGL